MRRREPAHRFLAVSSAKNPPSHPLEKALHALLNKGGTDAIVAYAHEVYTTPFEREVMQAFIVSGADDALIQQTLGVPLEVTQAYRHLFCDVTVFRDRLDLLRWAREYETSGGSKEGAALLKTATMQGPKALAWVYGQGTVEVEPQDVLKHAMADAYFRGATNRDYKLSTKEANVTHALMASAVKIATALDKAKPQNGNALAIKLRYREMTTPVGEGTPAVDLLH